MAQRISRVGALAALNAGVDARQENKPVTACPYDVNGSLTQQFYALWWVRGWRRAGALADEVPST